MQLGSHYIVAKALSAVTPYPRQHQCALLSLHFADLPPVLPFPAPPPQGDVVVLNMGAHYTRTMTFGQWKEHIDQFAQSIKQTIERTGAVMVFRSSFMWKEHVFRSYKEREPMLPVGLLRFRRS